MIRYHQEFLNLYTMSPYEMEGSARFETSDSSCFWAQLELKKCSMRTIWQIALSDTPADMLAVITP